MIVSLFFGLKNMIPTHTKDFFVKTRALDCHILDLVFEKNHQISISGSRK